MKTTRDEMLNLLRGWQQEKRLLECTVLMNNVRCRVLGHIDNIESTFVYVSAKSLNGAKFGDKFFLDIPFHDASYEYAEGQDAPEEYLRSAIERSYKGLLGITFVSGLKISLYVYKSKDELGENNG